MKYFEITDKNGNITAVSKLEYIQAEMKDFLSALLIEKETNDMRKKPLQIDFNTRIFHKLSLVLRQVERTMPNNEAIKITADEFYNLYNEYCELCCWIEQQMSISYQKNKAEFCNYCAISMEAYEEVIKNGDMWQKQELQSIDDEIALGLLLSSEYGETKGKATELHLTAKSNYGHKMQTVNNKEPMPAILITEHSFPPIQITKMPKAEKPKMLKGKKGED